MTHEPYAPFDAHTYQLDNGILTFRDSSGEQVGTMTMAEFASWREEARKVSVRGPDYRQEEAVSVSDLLGIAPDWTGGLTVDEYMNEQRGRTDPYEDEEGRALVQAIHDRKKDQA